MTTEGKTTVIAVSTEKGGTGKTTTASNLAAGLALKEKYAGTDGVVVLVDVDPQGDAAKFWGVQDRAFHEDRNPDGSCISDVLLGEMEVSAALIGLRENLYLLPASAKLKDAEFELVTREALAAAAERDAGTCRCRRFCGRDWSRLWAWCGGSSSTVRRTWGRWSRRCSTSRTGLWRRCSCSI